MLSPMAKRKKKGGGGANAGRGRAKRPRRGGKVECDLGADCPYRHEQQHMSEFWHAGAEVTAKRKQEQQRAASFKQPGRRLGRQQSHGSHGSQGNDLGGGSSDAGRIVGSRSRHGVRSTRSAAAIAAVQRATSQRAGKRRRPYNNNSNEQPSPSERIGAHLESLRVGGRSSAKRRRRNGIRGNSASSNLERSLSNFQGEVVDLSSPSPRKTFSSSTFNEKGLYGKDAQMKHEQDLAFDIGLAMDRSREDAERLTKETENESEELHEILERSKSTAREDMLKHWKNILEAEPHESSGIACATVDIRYPDGQRQRRRFAANAKTSQLVAFAGASGLIPIDLFDSNQWGVFTSHPRVLLQGNVAERSLMDNNLFPRALVHVGQLPLAQNSLGTGSNSQDAMELD